MADGRVRVAPPAVETRIRQVMRRMTPAGMMRVVSGLQAYLSVLGMEPVIAVNDGPTSTHKMVKEASGQMTLRSSCKQGDPGNTKMMTTSHHLKGLEDQAVSAEGGRW